ncbi:hypothetical protein F990_03334 [Acinetobacter tjernbergiae DSM 14971 = CIP 107465]|uniref:Uncharacterized protein n=2 Tax=Acinetobacter tjernbergiae TaxID=202955 RepID=V2W0F6_9GAMM|nr:hypothetical protein F990_03334 [Acinetobacter tjernbergiae DSM 14971 = CIP 107465]
MANRIFELQYSRFSIVLQLCIFVVILSLTYQLLSLLFWLLSFFIMAVTWFYFLKQPYIKHFEYLDEHDWSFRFSDPSLETQRRSITKIIDHQAYITIYFSDSHYSPCIIWWDQLPLLQWKNLKLWVKL